MNAEADLIQQRKLRLGQIHSGMATAQAQMTARTHFTFDDHPTASGSAMSPATSSHFGFDTRERRGHNFRSQMNHYNQMSSGYRAKKHSSSVRSSFLPSVSRVDAKGFIHVVDPMGAQVSELQYASAKNYRQRAMKKQSNFGVPQPVDSPARNESDLNGIRRQATQPIPRINKTSNE